MATNFEKLVNNKNKLADLLQSLAGEGMCESCPAEKYCRDYGCESAFVKWLEEDEDEKEKILLRANILGGLNSYIINLGDEEILEPWLMCGVPDGCTEDELMEIAEDEDEFRRIAKEFAKLI